MEQEIAMLGREFKAVEKDYGENVLHLTLARACIRKLLANVNVASFLLARHGDIQAEFDLIARTEAL